MENMKKFFSAFSIYLLCAYEGSLLSVYMAWLENGEREWRKRVHRDSGRYSSQTYMAMISKKSEKKVRD